MAMKKTAKPIRPGQGQPGGPPNPTSMKISSGVTVLGGKTVGIPSSRKPLSNASMKELKAMIAKMDAQKASVAKSSKKDAKIVKKQNKQAVRKADPVRKAATQKAPKKVVKVAPPRGGGLRGGMGFGGGGGLRGNVNR
jgi:hypothetical protein